MAGWASAGGPDLLALEQAVRRQASTKRSASIAVEDLTRPALLGPILDAVLAGLIAGGIDPSAIDLVIAVGAHRAPTPSEISRKVGHNVARTFPVRVHDPTAELAASGLKLGDRPLHVDGRFLTAEFRLGVGSVLPNAFAGFSGGGKLVLPGLASLEALVWLHKLAMMGFGGGVARLEGNRIRSEIDRIASELPLHMAVGCLVDAARNVREIFFGDPVDEHRRACARAREVYGTRVRGRFDVLFCNAFPKDGEFLQAENGYNPLRTGGLRCLSSGGSVVLMAACHLGRGYHGLFDAGMPLHRKARAAKGYLRDVSAFVYAPGITETACRVTHWEGYPFFAEWDELVETLVERHGAAARAGIFPAGGLQLCRDD
jgi:nickel-dependent lactate racemase